MYQARSKPRSCAQVVCMFCLAPWHASKRWRRCAALRTLHLVVVVEHDVPQRPAGMFQQLSG